MRRILSWVLWIPIAVVFISFVVANRQWVTLTLDPVNVAHPYLALSLPLWAVFVQGLFIGIITGWFAAWLKAGQHRKRARREHAELERLRRNAQAAPHTSAPVEPQNPLTII